MLQLFLPSHLALRTLMGGFPARGAGALLLISIHRAACPAVSDARAAWVVRATGIAHFCAFGIHRRTLVVAAGRHFDRIIPRAFRLHMLGYRGDICIIAVMLLPLI